MTKSIKDGVTVESVRDNWAKIVDVGNGDFPTSNQAATMDLVAKMRPLSEEGQEVTADDNSPANFVGYESEPFEYRFESKDVILYNMGVGASMAQSMGLDLLYEGSDNFGALTSFGVIPSFGGLTGLITGKVPGLSIDLSKVYQDPNFIRHALVHHKIKNVLGAAYFVQQQKRSIFSLGNRILGFRLLSKGDKSEDATV